jgi:protein CpxP
MTAYRPIRSAYAFAAAALLGSAALAAPVLAADTTSQTQAGAATSGTNAAKPARTAKTQGDVVERRLTTLHKQLKITPQQEDKWTAFAQTVRDNEARMTNLVMNRHQARNRTAVDDLRSYGDITEEHASSIKRLVTPFQDLYASMPDAQKKNADQVFARYEGRSEARETGAGAAKPNQAGTAAKPKS